MFLRTRRKLGLAKNCTEKILPETAGKKLRNSLTYGTKQIKTEILKYCSTYYLKEFIDSVVT